MWLDYNILPMYQYTGALTSKGKYIHVHVGEVIHLKDNLQLVQGLPRSLSATPPLPHHTHTWNILQYEMGVPFKLTGLRVNTTFVVEPGVSKVQVSYIN